VADSKLLAKGQVMEVKYPDEQKWHDASIIYLNPVANAAAGSQRVRLELKNEAWIRSGLQIDVRFKLPTGVAGAQPGK
jgi:hypothetical protein